MNDPKVAGLVVFKDTVVNGITRQNSANVSFNWRSFFGAGPIFSGTTFGGKNPNANKWNIGQADRHARFGDACRPAGAAGYQAGENGSYFQLAVQSAGKKVCLSVACIPFGNGLRGATVNCLRLRDSLERWPSG